MTDCKQMDYPKYFPTSVKTENAVKKSNKSEMNVKNIVFNKKIDSSIFDKEDFAW